MPHLLINEANERIKNSFQLSVKRLYSIRLTTLDKKEWITLMVPYLTVHFFTQVLWIVRKTSLRDHSPNSFP